MGTRAAPDGPISIRHSIFDGPQVIRTAAAKALSAYLARGIHHLKGETASMRSENALKRERLDLRAVVRPLADKLTSGEKLTNAEAAQLRTGSKEIDAIDRELLDMEEGRAASEAAHASFPAPGSEDRSNEERAFTNYLRSGIRAPELRAAGESTNSAGGYLVPPGWWQRLQVALKAYGGTAKDFAFLETDTGQPMQWATVDPTGIAAAIISENTQVSPQDYTFGQGTLGAYMYTSGVQLVSFQLAQDSAFDIDKFIQARVAESLGRGLARDAIGGTGTAQPLGVITALNSWSGSSGGKYSLTAASKVNVLGPGTGSSTTGSNQVTELIAGTLAPATFLQVLKSVDPAYRALGAKWYMNDSTLQATRGIVNGFGDPYYSEIQNDVAPTLYGYPVVVDNNILSLTASTPSGVLFGHMESAMVLRMVKGAGLMRLEERYADYLQVGFIGHQRLDVRSNDLRAAVVAVPAAT